MVRLLPLASGKGGVGKSVLAANLGIALARLGKTVVLVDLDLGGSNLHTCLGLRNRHPGIGSFIWKSEKSLAGLLVETGQERLWLIPGDNLLPGTANLEWNMKRRIMKELAALPADFAILDLGAGSSYNVVDFYLAAPAGLVVVNPEITSVLNAYSFLKTAAFRSLIRAFPDGSEERAAILEYAGTKTEGAGLSFIDFARDLASRSPERGKEALSRLEEIAPRVIMNKARSPEDAELGYRLRDISRKNLGLSPSFTGFILNDEAVPFSVAHRAPIVSAEPQSPFSRGVTALASRLASAPETAGKPFDAARDGSEGADGEDDATLESLAAEAFSQATLPT
jgi:flagellar biosynthesis protein FlhG